MPFVLSSAALGLVLVAWLTYLAAIPKEKVPVRPKASLFLMLVGVLLAILSMWLRAPVMGGAIVALDSSAIALALFFGYLLSLAPLPDGQLVVKVGDALPRFRALDGEGNVFDSADLEGQRVLLKFFRGSW